MQVHNIAKLVTRSYEGLTGKEPTFSSTSKRQGRKVAYAGSPMKRRTGKRLYGGQFHRFAQDVFDALEIRTDAMPYISDAAFKKRGKGRRR